MTGVSWVYRDIHRLGIFLEPSLRQAVLPHPLGYPSHRQSPVAHLYYPPTAP